MTTSTHLSYTFIPYEYRELIRLVDIEEPTRSDGISKYRSEIDYISIKNAMLNRVPLPPIFLKTKAKTRTEKFIVYDGFHRYHISKELQYEFIPVVFEDWDMYEFLENEQLRNTATSI